MNNLTVYKDNSIIAASYRLSLGEQRLILGCTGQIRSDIPMSEQTDYSISVGEYAGLFHISEKRAYEELRGVADRSRRKYKKK